MTRLGFILASAIIVSSFGCGKVSLPQKPQLIVDRASLGFGQEFGSCTRIGTSPQDSIKIENGGLENLVISSATYTGDSAFTVNGPTKTDIKGKESTFIQVLFTPTAEKIYNGQIDVESNAEATDGGGPMIVIKLSGRGCIVTSDGG
jgi:hypothetical protein